MIKIDCYLPSPILNKGMLFPESLGHYKNFPNHGERRNAGLLKEYNLHIIFEGKGVIVHDGKEIELSLAWASFLESIRRSNIELNPRIPGMSDGFILTGRM